MKKKIIVFIILLLTTSNAYAKESFFDVKNHWAEQYIYYLSSNNYIGGYVDNSFKPNKNISKAEVCTVINKVFNLNNDNSIEFPNGNIPWYYKDVKIAEKYKYVPELELSSYTNSITRIEIIQILGNIYNFNEENKDYLYFEDINSFNQKDKNTLGHLFKDGVISGYNNFKFKGNNTLSRAEFSKILTLSIQKYGTEIDTSKVIDDSKGSSDNEYSSLNLESIKSELQSTIDSANKIDLTQYSKDSASNLLLQLFRGETALNSSNKSEMEEAIKNINAAKKDLVYQTEEPTLTVVVLNENGDEIPANLFINEEPFDNKGKLKPGRYLLKVTSEDKSDFETHITMENEEKTIEVKMKEKSNDNLTLTLSENLESLSGYTFKENDRVTIKVSIPYGMEIDTFLVNSVPKHVIEDEFIFIIKEDTHVEVTFKNL